MTPILLAAADVPGLPEGNLGKVLALLVLVAMMLQPIVGKLIAKKETQKQTAIIQTGTNEQTELIMGAVNDVRGEVKRLRGAQEDMTRDREIERQDHSVRMGEFKRRIDGHDGDIGDLRKRVTVIEEGRKA